MLVEGGVTALLKCVSHRRGLPFADHGPGYRGHQLGVLAFRDRATIIAEADRVDAWNNGPAGCPPGGSATRAISSRASPAGSWLSSLARGLISGAAESVSIPRSMLAPTDGIATMELRCGRRGGGRNEP